MRAINKADGHAELLSQLYLQIPEAADGLPYTESFEWLYREFCSKTGLNLSRSEVWQLLTGIRKRGQLPRKCR